MKTRFTLTRRYLRAHIWLHRQCDRLSPKWQRRIVFALCAVYFFCSIAMIAQLFLPEERHDAQAIPASKLKAYELGRDEEKEDRKTMLLGTLADYFNRESEAKAEPQPAEEVPAAIGRSIDKYEETARELQSFYDLPAAELLPERETVVSSLDQPISDSAFIAEYGGKERNMSFRTVGKAAPSIARNTLSVVVDRTTTLQQGDYLRLRLAESARIEGMTLPRNTVLIAQSTIDAHRMKLHVTSVEHAGRILAVKLSAFDLDGQEGLSIPGSEEISALKEVGAGVGGTIGTSFTFASSAKDQLIAEAARGVMQGASQLLQKKLRTVKVTVKSGHRLFLVQAK